MTRLHSLTKVDAQSYEGCGSLTLRPILLTAKSTMPNNIYRPDNTRALSGESFLLLGERWPEHHGNSKPGGWEPKV